MSDHPFDGVHRDGAGDRAGDAPDRSGYPTRLRRLHDADDDTYVLSLTPSERVELVWRLTLQAWAFKEGLTVEPRLRRDVVRVVRRSH